MRRGSLAVTLRDFLTAGAGPGAVIAAIVAIFGWWISRRLERFKHELAATMEQRKLRAEYVRGQIENLYGPLAFLVEASARHLDTNRAVLEAYDGFFRGRHLTPSSEEEMTRTLDIANSYLDFVIENNHQAERRLRDGWGWLDRDDVDIALHFVAEVARLSTEYKNRRVQLPVGMYIEGINKAALAAPSFLPPALIERIREKLTAKQRELAGLTGAEPDRPAAISARAAKPALTAEDAPPALPAPKAG